MKWVDNFQLFLFDFDGLLADTEPVHYAACVEMMRRRGYTLTWDFKSYCETAHGVRDSGVKGRILKEFPDLCAEEPWEKVYREKAMIFLEMLKSAQLKLMPGVGPLLEVLQQKGIARCVVTNSTRDQIDLARERLPLLNTIPHWITREYYANPKPSPECYLKAIELYGRAGTPIIGFEDSRKGFEALQGTPAHPVLIAHERSVPNATYFSSFEEIPSDWIV